MQEAVAHTHLKRLLRQQPGTRCWPHQLTLSRLTARSLRRRDHTLVTITGGSDPSWLLGLLVPMTLCGQDTGLVASNRLRGRLLRVECAQLAKAGIPLAIWEGPGPPPRGSCWILNHKEWLAASENGTLADRQIVIPEGEHLAHALREAMTIALSAPDWEWLCRAHPGAGRELLGLHERLTRRVFSTCGSGEQDRIALESEDQEQLRRRLRELSGLPEPWGCWLGTHSDSWASWAIVDRPMLQWQWLHQPLEPLQACAGVFDRRGVIIADSSGMQDPAGLSRSSPSPPMPVRASTYRGGFRPTVRVHLSDPPLQDPLPLYLPQGQPLPNGPAYSVHLVENCRRLILGRIGLTVIVLDDAGLKSRLLSELASDYGRRVVHEQTSPESNGVLCCRWSWWITHQQRLPVPEQLVVALLPIASLEEPLTAARVAACKRSGGDWFRTLLLPEAISTLLQGAAPLRGRDGTRLWRSSMEG